MVNRGWPPEQRSGSGTLQRLTTRQDQRSCGWRGCHVAILLLLWHLVSQPPRLLLRSNTAELYTVFFLQSLDMSSSSNASTPQSPQPPRTPNSATDFHCEIRAVRAGDEESVLEHLRKFFFRDEPLNLDIKLLEGEDSSCLELDEFAIKSIQDGKSVIAVADDGKVIGVCLNTLDKRTNCNAKEEEECSNVKFCKIIKLLDYVDKHAQVFEHFPEIDRLVNVKILSVDSNIRGKGIAKLLMDQTRNNARREGIKLMRVDCSSEYSARAVQRLGFRSIYSMSYNEYLVDGELVFNPEPPHTCVRVFVQQIDSVDDKVEECGGGTEKKSEEKHKL